MLANNTGLSGEVVAMLNMAESTPLGLLAVTPFDCGDASTASSLENTHWRLGCQAGRSGAAPPGERNKRAGDGRWGDAKKGAVMKACLPLEASAAIAAGNGG